jgi:hypothetical protein
VRLYQDPAAIDLGCHLLYNQHPVIFPSYPQIDYVRLYQDPAAINVGCSPPDMPTEQYIAWWVMGLLEPCNASQDVFPQPEQTVAQAVCPQRLPALCSTACSHIHPCRNPAPSVHHTCTCSNRDTYVVTAADQVLVPQACQRLPSCRAEVGYEYLGGNLIGANGQPIKFENTATPQECCQVGGGGARRGRSAGASMACCSVGWGACWETKRQLAARHT